MVQLVTEGIRVVQHVDGGQRAGGDDLVGLSAAWVDFPGEERKKRGCESISGVNHSSGDDTTTVAQSTK